MLKKVTNSLVLTLLLVIFLSPVHSTLAATTTSKTTTKPTTTTAPAETTTNTSAQPTGDQQINDVKTIIGKNTPDFISKPLIWLVELLESFRKDGFNNPFIFYGLFFVILYMVVRSIWRFFF